MGQAHRGLRLASQLLITRAPAHWGDRYQSLLQEQQAASSRAKADDMQQAGMAVLFLTGVVSAVLVIHGLLPLLLALLPCVLLVGGFLLSSTLQRGVLVWRLTRSKQEVTNKLSQTVVRACLRLYVVGPINEPQAYEQALDWLIAAYGVYKGANSWKVGRRGKFGAKPLAVQPVSRWTRLMIWAGGDQTRPVLGMNEVTALWHLRPSDTILKDSNAYPKSGFPGASEQF